MVKTWIVLFVLASPIWVVSEEGAAAGWQDLLDQADSLAAAEDLDRASIAVGEALSKALTRYGKSDTTVGVSLYSDGGEETFFFGSYAEAETLYARVLSINERLLGRDHLEVAQTLMHLAQVFQDQGKCSDAVPLYERALAIREASLDPYDRDVGRTLDGLAGACYGLADYDRAGPLYSRSLSIRERALGPEHLEAAQSLHSLGNVRYCQGLYEEAEAFYRRALTIREKALGPEHRRVAHSLIGLAIICYYQGRYEEAEPLYKRALAITEKALGPEHAEVSTCLTNLANLYVVQGKYTEAEPLYRRAVAIWEKALGADHPQVAYGLSGLGDLYSRQGRYAEAEPLYRRALAIWEKALGPEHPEVAHSQNNLAILYSKQGMYAEAEPLYRRALAIWEKALGPEHPDVASSLNNLGSIYSYQGRYAEAEPLFGRAMTIWEKAFGPDHSDVAHSVNNLALVHREQGRYTQAEALYKRALAIWEKTLGAEHPNVAFCLGGLAVVYRRQGKYAEAEPINQRALAIAVNAFGPDHSSVAENLESICTLRRLQDQPAAAVELAEQASRIRRKNFEDNAPVLSERDALTYSHFLGSALDNYLTCYFESGSTDSATIRHVADVVFSVKGQVSDGIFERQRRLVEETDSTTSGLAEALRSVKSRLSRLFVEGPAADLAGHRGAVDSLSKLANELEADLSRRSSSYRQREDYKNVTAERIASLLPENSVLVEYVMYDYLELEPEAEIPRYMVAVLSRDFGIKIADLGDASRIDALVARYRDHILRVSSTGKTVTAVDRGEYAGICETIYSSLWKPIEGYVDGSDLVLVATDGALNMISFGGLACADGTYLVEMFPIHYLSSGRDVIRFKDETEPGSGLFALGDPDYDLTRSDRATPAAEDQETPLELAYHKMRNIRARCGDLADVTAKPLPGTRKEVDLVVSRWRRSTGETATARLGPDATEDRFKAEAPGCRVIHLATHGYFLEESCRPESPKTGLGSDMGFLGENPLLLSGLFLAGANLHGKGADSLQPEDGILTAYEVSAMNLDGTDLVVLSACETGLGKVAQGEGVYGLRRAFQMAGVRTVVSALWPVSDDVTAEMMGQLYERHDESIAETVRRIQVDSIKDFRRNGKPDHPFTWGGFIALGDWK